MAKRHLITDVDAEHLACELIQPDLRIIAARALVNSDPAPQRCRMAPAQFAKISVGDIERARLRG